MSFNWICTDADGSIYLYESENKPYIVDDAWYSDGLSLKYSDQDYPSDDWEESCLYIGP